MGRSSVSASPTSPDIRRLIDEGYVVALVDGMLAISNVPYVRAAGTLARGTLVVPVSIANDEVSTPRTHTAWWIGDAPREADGTPLKALNFSGTRNQRFTGLPPAALICGKPHGREFRDHHEFAATYVTVIGVPASLIDPTATARLYGPSVPIETRAGTFAYMDTATPRAGLGPAAETIRGTTIGILGLGGTGSYVLDLVSKCSVDAIHLYDDDLFEQHSAFRAPGAATLDDLRARRRKVDHFAAVYRGIHRRVVPPPVRIDARTAPILDVLDFAFVCIDDAAAKPPILKRLSERGIPYVDAGMGLRDTERGIAGAVRTTLVAKEDQGMAERIPVVGDPDGLYATNIQICELNALNASLAVIAWKRHRGFYASNRPQPNSVFVLENGRLHVEETSEPIIEETQHE